jgi:hypothetical protein
MTGEMTMATERQPDARAGGSSFWTSATGIVSAIAALITALVGAFALLQSVRSGQSADQTAKDPAGGQAAATASAGSPATSHAPAPVAAGAPIFNDDFIFDNDGVDLDGSPAPIPHPASGADAYSADTTMESMNRVRFVKWTDPADPGRDDCARKVALLGQSSVTIDVNTRVCLKTDRGRIVFLTVKTHQSSSASAWLVHAVIWTGTE